MDWDSVNAHKEGGVFFWMVIYNEKILHYWEKEEVFLFCVGGGGASGSPSFSLCWSVAQTAWGGVFFCCFQVELSSVFWALASLCWSCCLFSVCSQLGCNLRPFSAHGTGRQSFNEEFQVLTASVVPYRPGGWRVLSGLRFWPVQFPAVTKAVYHEDWLEKGKIWCKNEQKQRKDPLEFIILTLCNLIGCWQDREADWWKYCVL